MTSGIDKNRDQQVVIICDPRHLLSIFEAILLIAVDISSSAENRTEGGAVSYTDPSVHRNYLYRIYVETVAECLVRLDGEEFFHSLTHHGLVEAARSHILVGISIAQEYDVDAIADSRFLESHHLTVPGVIGRYICIRGFSWSQEGLEEWYQISRGIQVTLLSVSFPDRIQDVVLGAEQDITVIVIDFSYRSRIIDACISIIRAEVEVIPGIVSFLMDVLFFELPFIIVEPVIV